MKGIPASPGVAMARAVVIKETPGVHKEPHGSVDSELCAFEAALTSMICRLDRLSSTDGEGSDILKTHSMLLEDDTMIAPIRKMIAQDGCSAAYAVDSCMQKTAGQFRSMPDEYMSSRAADIDELRISFLNELSGGSRRDYSAISENCVLISHNPMLSDIIQIDAKRLKAVVTETGSPTSHCAILARTRGIPAVMGMNGICGAVKTGDLLIVDGNTGEVIPDPDKATVQRYATEEENIRRRTNELNKYLDKPCLSADGKLIEISANIGSPADVSAVLSANADGIGLFRSEFLYIDKIEPPTEEEQFDAYRQILLAMKGKPVTVRTLDAGGDKRVPCLHLPREDNPFLGYRAVRICLNDVSLFKTQLRALLRASVYGNLRIMLPMISSVEEVRCARKIILDVCKELEAAGIEAARNVPVGVMIEVPSAALMADEMAKEADFFSVGTNDLVQYVMAADRGNPGIAGLYSIYYPSVLRLLKSVAAAAHSANIPCGICGESAKEHEMLPLLIGFGFDEMSMSATSILETKERISRLDSYACRDAAQRAAAATTRAEAFEILSSHLKRDKN